MLVGVDVGGTFTDAVLLADGAIHTAKVPSTPADQSEGVLTAIERVAERASVSPAEVELFSHGMTVGTNALLERAGAPTALIATEGFTDLLEIARQDRVSLYRLCADRPPPLADPALRIGVRERIGPDGVVEELSESEIERVLAELEELDCEAVAICLLFSYRDPSHERRLAEAIRAARPELALSVSSEVLPRFREYERCSTTVIDAYLAPLLGRYLRRLGERCGEAGVPEPSVMQSSGGIATLEEAAAGAAWSVLSGPAGGAVGAANLARLSDAPDALGFDMGGTSCDVCVIRDGEVQRTTGREIGSRPIGLPMVDVHTVGAGGGSIGWRDAGGALRVGPRSAGADPGPAAYGRGGSEPTVTDANLVLGYLPGHGHLAGGVELDSEAAHAAIGRLAEQLGLEPLQAAAGIVRVANQEMIGALRVVTVERGLDPRDFALLAFGGAGGLHAAAIAAELEIDRVLCPRAGGVLSALGLIAGERRHDISRTVMLSDERLTAAAIAECVEEMAALASEGLGEGCRLEVVYEARYAGQAFELDVEATEAIDPAELGERFAAAHEERYGYRDERSAVELVGIRLAASEPAGDPDPELPETGDAPSRGERRLRFGERWLDGAVLEGLPAPGTEIEGPAVLELPETTLLVPPEAAAQVDPRGTVELILEGHDGA